MAGYFYWPLVGSKKCRLQFPSEYQAFTTIGSDMQSAGFFSLQRVVKTTVLVKDLL